jgi:predicted outer membrane repeat protein
MRAFKVLLPIVFGIAITFGALLGIANASSELNSPASPNGTIIYVHLYNDSGTYDGKSWDTAYKDLQDALAEAKSGDQIWVARGWYVTGNNRSDSFNLVPGVALYGGFYPAGGADEFSERDWENYRTILSGDVGQDDTPKVNGVVTTTDHIVGINSDHVVVADGTSTPITGNTVLDGFFITAGQANGSYPDNHGGGFYCDGSIGGECSPSLANLAFSGNYAGSGGAMYNDGDYGISLPSLKNVTFSGNSANSGGAMLNSSSNPDLWDVVFSDNSADSGGAIYNSYCSPSLENVTFSGNLAEYYGGAMYNNGHGGTSSPTLNRVTFYGNSADQGGAMFNHGQKSTSSPRLVNVIFSGNSADKGGAMYNHGREGNSSPSLSNVTFSGNDAEYGGAMFSTGTDGTSSPGLNNIILWGNTAAISGSQMYNEDISVTITTSLVQGGITGSGVHNENSTVTDGGGNLSADPDFVRDPDPGTDGNWDGVDDDYGDLHLMVGSPAIDTGTDSAISLPTDLDGNPRRVDGDGDGTAIVDMGAYEYNCPTGSILYVDHTASGTGSSWADAKPDLALGLELIVYCPHVSQVWVATGVYTPGIHREDSFELVPGVAVYGGFDPAGGADQFSERDWTSYPTILSGDIGGNDTHTDGVVMSATHIVGCNSYHVVTADGTNMPITAATVLDGFTITAGQAFTITAGQANDSYDLTNMMGGGFYCDGSGSGAECSPSLRNMIFSGNWADYRGGAMYNGGGYGGTSSPSLVDVTFSGNSADVGGAMYNNGHGGTSSPSLTNVVFSGNWANSSGGAMNNFGNFGTSSPNLENVTFSGNSAGINGGAMYNYGGGYGGASSPGLVDVTFSGNSAYRGGAMFSSSWNNGICSPSLTNVTFSGVGR